MTTPARCDLLPASQARPARGRSLWLCATCLLLLGVLGPASASAATWQLDTTFSDDGSLTTDIGGWGGVEALAIDSKGRIVAAGDSDIGNPPNPIGVFTLARYKPNGSLDKSFGGDGIVTTEIGGFSYATSVAIDRKRRIVVGGSSTATLPATDSDFAIARYKPDGRLDRGFGDNGKLTVDFGGYEDGLYTLAIDAEGRIVAGGFSAIGDTGGARFALARFKPDGRLDESFGGGGKVTTQIGSSSYANAVAIDAAGRIVAAGSSDPDDANDPDSGFALARYNPDGSLDTSFDGDGTLTTPIGGAPYAVARSLVIGPDGRIVAGGWGTTDNGEAFVLTRYNVNGSLDSSFSQDGKLMGTAGVSPNAANSIALDAAGRIVAGGLRFNGSHSEFTVMRFERDGSLDAGFSGGLITTVVGADSGAYALVLDHEGRIVLGGFSYSDGYAEQSFALARYTADVAGAATAPRTQRQHGDSIAVEVDVSAGEQLTAEAGGKIKVGRSYKLKPAQVELGAGQSGTLVLRPKGKLETRLAGALKRVRTATATLEVELTDEAGDTEVEELSVKLKR